MTEKDDLIEDEKIISNYLNELLTKGTVQAFTQRPDTRKSLLVAFKGALYPGSEVKIDCLNLEEATFCHAILHDSLEKAQPGIVNEELTSLGHIELTNGSCILIKVGE